MQTSNCYTASSLYRLEKRLYFRNENWQNQFDFKSNLKIHELSYDIPIDLRERSYCTVYFQRFNAKGIRLMKLALSTRSTRMQLKRHRLSKDTSSLTFYKNRCSSCDQWLSSGRWKIASAVGFPKNIDLQRTD